jgi:6-phosphofructokinase 1
MRRIAVLTSGGDAPGMNACLRAVIRSAIHHHLEVMGILQGYHGLLSSDLRSLNLRSAANIIQRGGTILGTARCEEMKTEAGMEKAIEVLHKEGIEGLITLGGDGTFRGARELSDRSGVKVVGIPATIDNDVYGTDFSIGFDTAVNTALESIDRIRDTAESLQRPFFIEVMGKNRGFIALEVGVGGGAESVLIPETKTMIEEICRRINQDIKRGKKSSIIVVAEGDEVGGVFRVAQQVWERLGIEYRICVLGHVQRGGSPTAQDRILGSKLGVAAVEALISDQTGCMVGEVKGEIALTPLEDTWRKVKPLDDYLLRLLPLLAT